MTEWSQNVWGWPDGDTGGSRALLDDLAVDRVEPGCSWPTLGQCAQRRFVRF